MLKIVKKNKKNCQYFQNCKKKNLHGDVEAGEGEQDEDQAEVDIVERVLELAQVARLIAHSQSHLTISCDLVP